MEREIEKLGDRNAHIKLLTLRRHVKDFMLRHDEQYIAKLYSDAQLLMPVLSGPTQSYLQKYIIELTDFVTTTKEIGLDSESGIRGTMRATVHRVEDLLESDH
jgi:methyl-accepting chemotaxis protein